MPKGALRSPAHAPTGRPHHPPPRLLASGPFASSVGVGRAEPEWADKNKVTGLCGKDRINAEGNPTDAPIQLPAVRAAPPRHPSTACASTHLCTAPRSGRIGAESTAQERLTCGTAPPLDRRT